MTIPPPSAHGDDVEAVARALGVGPDELLDLAVTLNPVAPDPVPVVARHLAAVRRYPAAAAVQDATEVLAAAVGIAADRVLLTNGGAEAIALVAAEVGGGWVDDPEFSLYRRHLPRVDRSLPRFRSNPHNPTGRLAPVSVDEPPTVWDEAFYPLATGEWTRGDADRGSWVVGSLTKLLACPGLRLGYVLAPTVDDRARLAHRQPRWSVGGPALASLPDLLAAVDLPAWSAAVRDLRGELVDLLGRFGIASDPSDAGFVLARAPGLRAQLAPEGVLVRDCRSFGLPDHVRIAVPDHEGLARLGRALEAAAGGAGQNADGW